MTEDNVEGKVDWVRGPKKIDPSKVSLEKIRKAHKERGIGIEVDADRPGQSKVTKTVVKGMPAPKSSEKGKV